MEDSKVKVLVLYIMLLISLFVSFMLLLDNLYEYLIVFSSLSIILLITLIYKLKVVNFTPEQVYKHTVDKIVKAYNPILVNTDKFPKLNNRSILKVNSLDDLIDAQAEMRKPIYYVKSEDATAFYIINEDVFLIYFIKLDKNNMTLLEMDLKAIELRSSINLDAIKDFDKTVIIQTNEKSYKISPIREVKKEVSVENTKEIKTKDKEKK